MADIAGVFHWPLSELRQLDVGELLVWRERAVAWWNRTNRTGKDGA